MAKKLKIKQVYWYLFLHEECALCGRSSTIKRRIYNKPKPQDPAKRHIFLQFACGIHFA